MAARTDRDLRWLADQFDRLARRITELSRQGKLYPVAEVILPESVNATSGYSLAGARYSPVVDPYGMFRSGAPCSLVIPVRGRYLVSHRATYGAVATGVGTQVFRNGTTVGTHEVVFDNRPGSTAIYVSSCAWREVLLSPGDVLYWGFYASDAGTLLGDASGVRSHMYLRYIGPS